MIENKEQLLDRIAAGVRAVKPGGAIKALLIVDEAAVSDLFQGEIPATMLGLNTYIGAYISVGWESCMVEKLLVYPLLAQGLGHLSRDFINAYDAGA